MGHATIIRHYLTGGDGEPHGPCGRAKRCASGEQATVALSVWYTPHDDFPARPIMAVLVCSACVAQMVADLQTWAVDFARHAGHAGIKVVQFDPADAPEMSRPTNDN